MGKRISFIVVAILCFGSIFAQEAKDKEGSASQNSKGSILSGPSINSPSSTSSSNSMSMGNTSSSADDDVDRNLVMVPDLNTTPELKDFCPVAYKYLKSSEDCYLAGGLFLGFGLAGTMLSVVFAAKKYNTTATLSLLGVGVGCVLVGVPCFCVGPAKQKKARSAYDECVSRQKNYSSMNRFNGIDVNLQASQDGFGLALAF